MDRPTTRHPARSLVAAVACSLGLPLLAVVAASAVPAPASAAPEPALIPIRWQLDVRPGPLRVAMVDVETQVPGPGESVLTVRQPRHFFYMTYTVVNNSGEDLMFAPSFELGADDGSLIRSGRDVPSEVTAEILNRLRNPFLLDQISIIGTLTQGEENAREGLVIWPVDNFKVDEVTVFASGFSGETRRVTRPDTGEEVVLRKVLMLRHATPGDVLGQGDRPFDRVQQRWILR